jgi:uncharacterized membrane protein (DUF485 family)
LTTPQEPPDRAALLDGVWAYNARVGLVLFSIYLLFFAGFITLAAFGKEVMARHMALIDPDGGVWSCFGGVNVAIVYGFFLIIAAFVLALLYMMLCLPEPVEPEMVELTEVQISDLAQSEEGSA